jgi:hypothetical protein
MPSEIKYARNGDVSIAYQVLGNGPIDIIYVPSFVSSLELTTASKHGRTCLSAAMKAWSPRTPRRPTGEGAHSRG